MASDSEICLKLLIDKEANKVLYAECGKDFVDFLLSLLSMRMSTMICLLGKQSMLGCIDNIYQSVENLDNLYMSQPKEKKKDLYVLQPKDDKKKLLRPNFVPRFRLKKIQLLPALPKKKHKRKRELTPYERHIFQERSQQKPKENTVYTCSRCQQYVSPRPEGYCPGCDSSFWTEVNVVDSSELENITGHVRGLLPYIVTDDLVVTPLSTLACLEVAKKSNVRDINLLEEKTFNMGFNEARYLAKAVFGSKSVLTDVFLRVKLQELLYILSITSAPDLLYSVKTLWFDDKFMFR